MKTKLTKMQRAVLITAIVPMIAVGVAGGIGTYTNISHRYGSGTAVGALAAGEGATAVLALVLLVTTLLGQSAPALVRMGLWALPAAASAMGATAATGIGQAIVYGLTPMAITASAEGIAFLSRRVVIHQEGRDIEAEARAAGVIRDLAYHQARAAAHPSKGARKRSVRKSWRLARRVGSGDVRLGADLMDVQRVRLTSGADAALATMFGGTDPAAQVPALPAVSAPGPLAISAASTDGATTPGLNDATVQADANGHPSDTPSEQDGEGQNVRPDLKIVPTGPAKKLSIAADVRRMAEDGVKDIRHVLDAVATRHGRKADDPKFQQTVSRYWRQATATPESAAKDAPSPYL